MTHPDGPQASHGVLTNREIVGLSQRDLHVHHVEIEDNKRRSGLSHTDAIGKNRGCCAIKGFFSDLCKVLAEFMLPSGRLFLHFYQTCLHYLIFLAY
jgi:hypothetical protein